MADKMTLLEAVRLAKESLGDVPTAEMVAYLEANFGQAVNPVIVTVMLGSFLEREHTERMRLVALEMVEKAKAEQPAEKPKGRKKAEQPRTDCGAGRSPSLQKAACGRGCPDCGSSDYVFRGRKKVPPKPDEEAPAMETKHCCRACGHHWKVRVPVSDSSGRGTEA